jgi:hypothetical protein
LRWIDVYLVLYAYQNQYKEQTESGQNLSEYYNTEHGTSLGTVRWSSPIEGFGLLLALKSSAVLQGE